MKSSTSKSPRPEVKGISSSISNNKNSSYLACNSSGYARFSLHVQRGVRRELPKGADVDDIAIEIERRWSSLSVDERDHWGYTFSEGRPMCIARVETPQHTKEYKAVVVPKDDTSSTFTKTRRDTTITSHGSGEVHHTNNFGTWEHNAPYYGSQEKVATQESEVQNNSKTWKRKRGGGGTDNMQDPSTEVAEETMHDTEKRKNPQQEANRNSVLNKNIIVGRSVLSHQYKHEFADTFYQPAKFHGFLQTERIIPFDAHINNLSPSICSIPTSKNSGRKDHSKHQQKLQQSESPQLNIVDPSNTQGQIISEPSCKDKCVQEEIRKRPYKCLATEDDINQLSSFLRFLRKECIEVFEATSEDVEARKPLKIINLYQVGIRCRFCAFLNIKKRVGRSATFPSSRSRIYQSVKMMIREHFPFCTAMLPEVREKFIMHRSGSSNTKKKGISRRSKTYWAESALSLGMEDTNEGLKLKKSLS